MAKANEKTVDLNTEIDELKKSKEKEEKRNKELEKTILLEQKDKKEMKSTIELLQKQLEETQKMIMSLSMNNVSQNTVGEEKLYPVINMFIGELILLNGDISFEKHGDILDLPKNLIRELVQKHQKFAQKGYFYIADEDLVKEFRLTKYYRQMLTVEELEHFFDVGIKDMEKLYNKAPEGQRQVIIDKALNSKKYGIEISAEKLIVLSRLSGKTLVEI